MKTLAEFGILRINHELAVVLLRVTNTSKVVMQRRSVDDKIAPGLIGCFGGHIEPGETPVGALLRELREETSLVLSEADVRQLSVTNITYSSEFRGALKAYLFEAYIPSADFKLYDGIQAEVYELPELLKRSDLAPSARLVFSNLPPA
jgi:8-oxo-dGTP pyrophosphatase MutT (NUDIX family)